MFFRQRKLEVDGGQEGKDVGLKYGDQYFEECKGNAECDGAQAKRGHPRVGIQNEKVGGGEEENQQEVANNHVHQKTQGQRDRTKDERRHQFNGRHDDVERPRHTRGNKRVLQERNRVLAKPRIDESDVSRNRKDQRHADHTGSSNIQTRDDAGQVHKQNQEEDAGEQRQEALAIFFTQKVFGDVDPNQVQSHFDNALEPTGDNLHFSGAEPEDQDQRDDGKKTNQDDSVHLEDGALKKNCGREKLSDSGRRKLSRVVGG